MPDIAWMQPDVDLSVHLLQEAAGRRLETRAAKDNNYPGRCELHGLQRVDERQDLAQLGLCRGDAGCRAVGHQYRPVAPRAVARCSAARAVSRTQPISRARTARGTSTTRNSLTGVGTAAHKILALLLAFAIVAGTSGGIAVAMPVDQDCTMAGSCEDRAVPSGCDVLCVAGSPACAVASANVNPEVSHIAPAARPGISPSALLRAPDTAPPKPAAV